MLGDTAAAVNPDDERYKSLVGQFIDLPLVGRRIPIIADSYVDMEFGTGCVKITLPMTSMTMPANAISRNKYPHWRCMHQ